MEKILDTLAQMVDGKEWNDESDGLFALSGNIDEGMIQATLKGTPTALVSVIVAHMTENQYVEALIMAAVQMTTVVTMNAISRTLSTLRR